MLRNRRLSLILAAALIMAQALGVAHAFEHPLVTPADHDCVVCAHGQGLDDAIAHGLGGVEIDLAPAIYLIEETRDSVSTGVVAYRSRAPPHLV